MVPLEPIPAASVNHLLSPSCIWTISRLPRHSRVQTTCRMNLFSKAKDLGIQTEFVDGHGQPHVTAAEALQVVFDALPPQAARQLIDGPVVVRQGHATRTTLLPAARFPVRWEISGETSVVAGEAHGGALEWAANLPLGVGSLRLSDAGGVIEEVPLVSAPVTVVGG